jgi:hypothetical protein
LEFTALSQYALYFGLVLILLIAVSAAGIALRRGALIVRRTKDRSYVAYTEDRSYVAYADFERGIEDLRREFRHSNDAAQSAARRATMIGENLISINKQVELVLRDLNGRLRRVEQQANETASFVVGLHKQLSENNGQISIQTETLQPRFIAITNQLRLLEKMIEAVKGRGESNDTETEAINARLGDIQRQIDGLFPRLELEEKQRADLSALHHSLAETLKALTISSGQIGHRIADLEQRFLLITTKFEARFTSTRAHERPPATLDIDDAEVIAAPGGAKTNSNGTGNNGSDDASRPHFFPVPNISGVGNPTDDCRPSVAPENRVGGSRTGRETIGQGKSPFEMAVRPKTGDWKILLEVDASDSSKPDVQGTTSSPRGSNAVQFGPPRDLTTPLQIEDAGAAAMERNVTTAADPISSFRLAIMRDLTLADNSRFRDSGVTDRRRAVTGARGFAQIGPVARQARRLLKKVFGKKLR